MVIVTHIGTYRNIYEVVCKNNIRIKYNQHTIQLRDFAEVWAVAYLLHSLPYSFIAASLI